MWCPSCQSDVAGEVSPDAKSLLCTTCRSEVSSLKNSGKLPTTHGARELLERWNTEEILDPYQMGRRQISEAATSDSDADLTMQTGETSTPTSEHAESDRIEQVTSNGSEPSKPIVAKEPAATVPPVKEATPADREARVARRPSQRTFRVDGQHKDNGAEARPSTSPHKPRDVHASHGGRIDGSHATAPAPHFSIDSAFDKNRKPGRGESLWGQLLAYAGVGVLTVGTGLVVWGYFGGPDSYTPTGWLLATAGQMLLFLGVVTLISGGMEQTTHEVSQRIERLGDHILRIERHTAEHALSGPHFPIAEEGEGRTQAADRAEASAT